MNQLELLRARFPAELGRCDVLSQRGNGRVLFSVKDAQTYHDAFTQTIADSILWLSERLKIRDVAVDGMEWPLQVAARGGSVHEVLPGGERRPITNLGKDRGFQGSSQRLMTGPRFHGLIRGADRADLLSRQGECLIALREQFRSLRDSLASAVKRLIEVAPQFVSGAPLLAVTALVNDDGQLGAVDGLLEAAQRSAIDISAFPALRLYAGARYVPATLEALPEEVQQLLLVLRSKAPETVSVELEELWQERGASGAPPQRYEQMSRLEEVVVGHLRTAAMMYGADLTEYPTLGAVADHVEQADLLLTGAMPEQLDFEIEALVHELVRAERESRASPFLHVLFTAHTAERLIGSRLMPAQHRRVVARQLSERSVRSVLSELGVELDAPSGDLDVAFDLAHEFYACAVSRGRFIADRITQIFQQLSADDVGLRRLVFCATGFVAGIVCDELSRSDISVVSITPGLDLAGERLSGNSFIEKSLDRLALELRGARPRTRFL